MVLPVRIELTTSPLPRGCSTTELRQQPDEMNALKNRGDHCHMGRIRASAPRALPPLSCPAIAVRRTASLRSPVCRVSTSLTPGDTKDVDGRDKPGHDGVCCERSASVL